MGAVLMRPELLPPWDALPYYTTPVERRFTATGGRVEVAPADPTRECLVFSLPLSSGAVILSTAPGTSPASGLQVNASAPVLSLSRATHGPLVNVAWWVETLATTLTVIQVSLARWPNTDDPPPLAGMSTRFARPQRNIDQTPSANGSKGILDYWFRKVSSVFGVRGRG